MSTQNLSIIPATPTTTKVKPPLNKRELLLATATALYREEEKQQARACKERERLRKIRDTLVIREAKRRKKTWTAQVDERSWDGNYRVIFSCDIPLNEVAAIETQVYKAAPILRRRSVEDIYRELKSKSSSSERITAALSDKNFASKLVSFGRELLTPSTPVSVA